ncbi:PTS cellobiose transporter subunit IIB [Streptococcus moroccensis]|uniref:PTS system cellobiose-specific IIB component n=1 Tax=Streptococcus moroccensis TaxID=1451356 RepID=A0ABT9YPH6_9STRE|nr:PTS cellobiose transporter subunit IIB [Streptococcus moroccensis]MDQ0221904.1 PTS system cellobiose-specific IIB component [Streptococcus moroccensis]
MVKQVLLMCAGGMSSSLMAKKVTAYLQEKGQTIEVVARGIGYGKEELKKTAAYDLYLVSPQVRMYFETIEKLAEQAKKPVLQVPAPAYVPIPKGIMAMAVLILAHFSANQLD